MSERIVIHEWVDTVRGREEDYMAAIDAMREFPPPWRRAARQLGLFRTTEASGTWPRVVNLWDHSWTGVMADLQRQFQDAGRDRMLESWWSENTDVRSGGEDRLLIPSAFSPTLDELIERRVFGRVFLHEIVDVGPAGVERHLDALGGDLEELELGGGFLVGAFRVAWRPSEVVTMTGFRDFAALVEAVDGTSVLARRRRERSAAVRRSHSMIMLPARCSPIGPERVLGSAWTSG